MNKCAWPALSLFDHKCFQVCAFVHAWVTSWRCLEPKWMDSTKVKRETLINLRGRRYIFGNKNYCFQSLQPKFWRIKAVDGLWYVVLLKILYCREWNAIKVCQNFTKTLKIQMIDIQCWIIIHNRHNEVVHVYLTMTFHILSPKCTACLPLSLLHP